MDYRRDPAPLTRVQRELSMFALGERFHYSFVIFCVTVSGPVLTFVSYGQNNSADWAQEPRLGAWTWHLFVLLPLGPMVYRLRQRVLARRYLYVFDYWSGALLDAFKRCMELLYELPEDEEQRRPLWLDAVKAYEASDVTQLNDLTKLLKKLTEALERRKEAQQQALRNKYVLQDTLNRIETLNLETELLQKEFTS